MRNILLPWHWKRAVSASLDARVASVITAIDEFRNDFRTRMAKFDEELSELREELYTVRHTLSRQLDDVSWHKLKSSAWDIQRGLAAVKNEIAAQVGISLHDIASQTADQRLWLERINEELAGLRARFDELYKLARDTSLPAQSRGSTNREVKVATAPTKFSTNQNINVDQSAVGEDPALNGEFDLKSREAGTR